MGPAILEGDIILKYGLVARKAKDRGRVAFCISKGYETTGTAHPSKLQVAHVGRASAFKAEGRRFNSYLLIKKAKSVPVVC